MKLNLSKKEINVLIQVIDKLQAIEGPWVIDNISLNELVRKLTTNRAKSTTTTTK